MDKKALRQQIKEMKKAMSEAEIENASLALAEKFFACQQYKQAKTVYGYLPYNQEVRTVSILQKALDDGKRVAVPKVYGDEMRFIYLTDLSQVEKGYCGIPEPVADEPVADDPTALVLMPGLAFDPAGHRIGYGGGFYDRYLEMYPNMKKIAFAFEFQIFEQVPYEEFDIKPEKIITESRIIV